MEQPFSCIRRFYEQIQQIKNTEIPIVLIGNKSDLRDRQTSSDDGRNLAEEFHSPFLETSATTGYNVLEAFSYAVRLVRICQHQQVRAGAEPVMVVNESKGMESWLSAFTSFLVKFACF